MDAKEIRARLQRSAHPCPNCGGLLLLEIEGDAEVGEIVSRLGQKVADGTAHFRWSTIEDAEEDLRENIDASATGSAIGGKVRR